MSIAVDLQCEAGDWASLPGLDALVQAAVEVAAAEAGLAPALPAEVSVLLADDAAIQALNAQWRGKDKPTNVLSFPAGEAPAVPGVPRLLGDIAVAWETTRREAADEGKTVAAHLSHLLVHGTLHLLDHDHEEDGAAEAMESLERRALARLGIADPYAGADLDRADAP